MGARGSAAGGERGGKGDEESDGERSSAGDGEKSSAGDGEGEGDGEGSSERREREAAVLGRESCERERARSREGKVGKQKTFVA